MVLYKTEGFVNEVLPVFDKELCEKVVPLFSVVLGVDLSILETIRAI